MVSTHAQKLACEIVGEQFGDICQTVASSLIYRGQQTLPDLGRDTGLAGGLLKKALLVLIQHSCVQSYQNDEDINAHGIPIASITFYDSQLDKILQRLRYPNFLIHIKDTQGALHETLIESMLENGRVRVRQLLAMAERKKKGGDGSGQAGGGGEQEGGDGGAGGVEEGEEDVELAVREAFVVLVREHYLERAPTANMPPPPLPEPAGGRGRGKANNAAAAVAEAAAAAANAAAMREARERYQLPRFLTEPGYGLGGRRKRKAIVIEGRVNHEEFCRRFRHMACVKLVREKVHANAGLVMEGMLSLTRQHEDRLKQERSVPLAVQDVEEKVREMEDERGGGASMDSVKQVLRELAEDSVELISRVGEGPGGSTYCVNLKRIVELIQLKEVEAVVQERFGSQACRVFRLLVLKLEQKQIAEMAMIPMKETRELLYCLLKAEYVSLQEVAKTADHAPSRTFYLWRVEVNKVSDKLSGELYKAASNMRARLKHDMDEHSEVLRLLEVNMAARDGAGPAVVVTASQRRQLEYVKRVAGVLQSSLMRLDHLIMVFNDWA